MDLIAHFVFGLWIYQDFGNIWIILLSCITDIDHLIGYIYDRRKKSSIQIPKLLHLAYRPRSWFHSFTGLLTVFIPLSFFLPTPVVLLPLLSHLLLDALDKNGISIFPPFLKKRIKGALPVGYLMEDPNYLKRHKRSHVPSLILIAIISLLILYGI